MTIDEIRKHWKPNIKNSQLAIALWNSKAASFASKDVPTVEDSLTMRLIVKNQMCIKEQAALDVGCGGG